jgi:hypothetical protein
MTGKEQTEDSEYLYHKGDFIGSCMKSSKMVGEFPDEKQREALCNSYYENKFQFDFPEGTCWTGYEPYGTKIVDGREVPNCIPVEMKQELEAKETLDTLREMLKKVDITK